MSLLLCKALGLRRYFGERSVSPLLPKSVGEVTLEMVRDGRCTRWHFQA
jgi:hypothetical protein